MRRWWIIPALAGILVVGAVAYWGYGVTRDNRQLVTYLNNRNQRSFYELMGNVEHMEVMLSKGIVSGSPTQRMMIFSDIWREAYAAQENLTSIPIAGPSLTRTSAFLSQTGDYAWSLAKKYARGIAVKPEELDKLNELHTEAGYLAAELQKIEKNASDGRLLWSEIKSRGDKTLKDRTPVPDSLTEINRNMEEFPTLIYDGPFSDHILQRKPLGLTGKQITRAQASDLARRFVEAGVNTKYRVTDTETVNGLIPAFRIHLLPVNNPAPRVIVDVSKKGGHILMMVNTRSVGNDRISPEKAVTIAGKFLAGRRIMNMKPTYTIEQQNTAVVIFEYEQDGVLIYPDLMKVKVALDTGEVVGFEGTGFVMNHHPRNLPKPKVSRKEALEAVNPELKVMSEKLAVIPLENLEEVLVYEFRGDLKGDTFIVYINAVTGEEEQVLKVIDTNSGPVTM